MTKSRGSGTPILCGRGVRQWRQLGSGRAPGAFRAGLAQADTAVGSERVADISVSHLAVEPLRIEVAAGPAFGFAVLGIFGVGDDIEEVGVAVDAADILGRSGAGAIDAVGSARLRVEGEEPLEFDDVLPVIAKVVDIE